MDILLSIKPKYAQMIYDGTKRYEYRRRMPRKLNVGDTVYLYETAPVKAVTGYFIVGDGGIVTTDRHLLWRMTKEYAGISRVEFLRYFHGDGVYVEASAIKVCNHYKYLYSRPLHHFFKKKAGARTRSMVIPSAIMKAPQSFCYIIAVQPLA